LSDVLRLLPKSAHPDVLVGFATRDDAGVFRLSESQALVQTVDFFTPVVDDPYAFGAIAAANALSDVYAMGGRPITALNIACFDPQAAPADVWANVLLGAHDKVVESGAVLVGGHSVEDSEPKFGLAVTGVVDPSKMFVNTSAEPGDDIYLAKPLGTGIVSTALKNGLASAEEIAAATESMSQLNAAACEAGVRAGVRCATDITGFGLLGHLLHVARESGVVLEVDSQSLPVLPGVERLVGLGCLTGGASRNLEFVEPFLRWGGPVPEWLQHVVVDPQTSGGLALFSKTPIEGHAKIGRVVASGEVAIHVG